jgi:hypothetical protein
MAATFRHGLVPSDRPSWNSGGTSNILPEELSRATFDIEKMTNVSLLESYSSVQRTDVRRYYSFWMVERKKQRNDVGLYHKRMEMTFRIVRKLEERNK